jgi:hypothetical protein
MVCATERGFAVWAFRPWRLEQVRVLLAVHEKAPGHSEHDEWQASHQSYVALAEGAVILADQIKAADALRPGPNCAASFAIAPRAINRRNAQSAVLRSPIRAAE